eukprot:scaffold1104_cov187-Skeletonema_menzelii.AAC.6
MKFYHGLNTLDIQKKKKTVIKIKMEEVRVIIAEMKVAAYHSDSNHGHMLRLLEAEWNSIEKAHDGSAVAASYETAIAAARNSKFIHAEGLACEKAGFYHKRSKDAQSAMKYFKQARECYAKWGSNVKVAFVQRELDALEDAEAYALSDEYIIVKY